MAIKDSRTASFFVAALIYVLAAAVGIWVYNLIAGAVWFRLLIADVAATVLTFIFSLIFKNASVYDPYWSVQPMVIVAAFAIGRELTAARVFMLVAIYLWGLRLTANWAYTFMGLNKQDWRYTLLHEKTGKAYPLINFLGIHLVPTLVVYGCVLPAVALFENNTGCNLGSVLFFALSVGAFLLQGTADIQMHTFRKRKREGFTDEPFIRSGLWKYSRHPNYLGEILMWWGVALAAVCVLPHKWYLIMGAVANTLLFLLVSIPLADGRQAAKAGFADYKKSTRQLLPIKK